MNFNLKIFNSIGNEISYSEMDQIVCKLWNVTENNDKWAFPHGKRYENNWCELLGLACMTINRGGVIKAIDLFEPIVKYTTLFELDDFDDKLETNRLELKLLLFWIKEGYWFIKSYTTVQ